MQTGPALYFVMKNDIATTEDIKALVNSFYDRVQDDTLLAPVFAHVKWENHLPIMYQFWGSMLLGEATYRGNPLQRHVHLDIRKEHFAAWLEVWHSTIDSLFAGPVADEAKMRGHAIAGVFQHRLGIIKKEGPPNRIQITEV